MSTVSSRTFPSSRAFKRHVDITHEIIENKEYQSTSFTTNSSSSSVFEANKASKEK